MYACVNISAADRFCCITDMRFVFREYSEICKAVLMLHGWDNLEKKKEFQETLWKKNQTGSKVELSNQFKSKYVIHNTKLKNSLLLIWFCLLSVVKDWIIDNLLTSWNETAESHFSQVTSLESRTREAGEPFDHCNLLLAQ